MLFGNFVLNRSSDLLIKRANDGRRALHLSNAASVIRTNSLDWKIGTAQYRIGTIAILKIESEQTFWLPMASHDTEPFVARPGLFGKVITVVGAPSCYVPTLKRF